MEYKNYIVFIMGFSGSGKRTIAQEVAKYPYFKLVDNMVMNSPIVNLLDMAALNQRVPEEAWQQINKIRDVVFATMRDLSPPHFSFVITHDMVDGEAYPQTLFNLVQELANARRAYFLPVRLECSEEELVKRTSSAERKAMNKITDVDRVINMARNKKVFYSKHPNEITIDVTRMSAIEVAKLILDSIKKYI